MQQDYPVFNRSLKVKEKDKNNLYFVTCEFKISQNCCGKVVRRYRAIMENIKTHKEYKCRNCSAKEAYQKKIGRKNETRQVSENSTITEEITKDRILEFSENLNCSDETFCKINCKPCISKNCEKRFECDFASIKQKITEYGFFVCDECEDEMLRLPYYSRDDLGYTEECIIQCPLNTSLKCRNIYKYQRNSIDQNRSKHDGEFRMYILH